MIKLGNYKPQNYWNNHTKTESFYNDNDTNSSKYYGFWGSDCSLVTCLNVPWVPIGLKVPGNLGRDINMS